MCGFVGLVRDPSFGLVTREDLEALLPDLAHRGPDGSGVVIGLGVGLAATRLAIQGDHRSDQPLVTAGRRLALAFNGELLATEQGILRRTLEEAGVAAPPPAAGDTALLAAAFAWDIERGGVLGSRPAGPGAEAVLRALGRSMGALAVVDLHQGTFFLARDRLGIKPLFHAEMPRGSFFASEMKPLVRAGGGAATADTASLAWLARWQEPYTSGALPIWDIESLPEGGLGTLEREGRDSMFDVSEGYAHLWPPTAKRAKGRGPAARSAFERSLSRVCREAAAVDGPVSVFLSGGLDSAAAAAFADRPDLLAITGRFLPHGGDSDESPAAAAVCGALGLRHQVVDLHDADLIDDLEVVLHALEVPLAGPGSLALWRLARRAREHGRVVLTGTGGDELLGGYARTALALGRAGPWTRGYEVLAARIPPGAGAGRAVRSMNDRSSDLAQLFDPEFARGLAHMAAGHTGLAEAAAEEDVERDEALGALDAALWPEIHGTLPALLHVEDRVLMAHGLEGRPVFCLGDVPDAALALHPDDVVGPDGEGKVALRKILKGRIPEDVRLDKRKRGFPTPFGRAARGAGRERVESILADRRFRERGWWNVEACRALLDEERPPHDRALFALLSWEIWARLFLDGDAFRIPVPPSSPGAPVTPGARGR